MRPVIDAVSQGQTPAASGARPIPHAHSVRVENTFGLTKPLTHKEAS